MTQTNLPEPSQSLIGCMLSDSNVCLDVLATVKAIHLRGVYMDAFRMIEGMVSAGKEVNVSTLNAEWAKEKDDVMPFVPMTAPDATPSPHNWQIYAEELIDSHRRQMISYAAHNLAEDAKDRTKPVDKLLLDAERIIAESDPQTIKIESTEDNWKAFVNDLEHRYELNGALPGISTGFYDLDDCIGGLEKKTLTVIAARPSQGKTAIGCSVATRAAIENLEPTLFVSLEMGREAIQRRMLSIWGNIPIKSMQRGRLAKEDFEVIHAFGLRIRKSPFHFINGVKGVTSAELAAVCRRAVKRYGVKLVIVDYLQKLRASGKHEKRTYEIEEVSTTLKAIADTNNIAVLALAQLNRESVKENKPRVPRLSDLADCGKIEADADNVGMLYRVPDKDDHTQLIICKQRDGELACIDLHFNGACAKFTSMANV